MQGGSHWSTGVAGMLRPAWLKSRACTLLVAEMVVARSPPPGADSRMQTWAPRLGLKPARLSNLARWQVGWRAVGAQWLRA